MKYKAIIDPQVKLDLKEIFTYGAMNNSIKSANKLLKINNKSYRIIYEIEKKHNIHSLRN